MIILMAGLPGTGKSTLAAALATRLSGTVRSKDEIRHALFSGRDVEYSTEQDDFVMEVMLQAAERILRKHPARYVFLDGRTFSRNYQIERVVAFAARLGQRCQIVECVCSDETARARLELHAREGVHPAGNRTFDLYLDIKRRFEPITRPKITMDTDQPFEICIDKALSQLT
jgi:predicted kinase